MKSFTNCKNVSGLDTRVRGVGSQMPPGTNGTLAPETSGDTLRLAEQDEAWSWSQLCVEESATENAPPTNVTKTEVRHLTDLI
jgi:hypothetical protein